QALAEDLFNRGEKAFEAREKEIGTELLLRIFRHVYLEELDKSWVDHLTDMDHLRDGIGLRGYGQKDPKQEYKKEGYNLFVTMVARVQSNVMTKVFAMKVRREEEEQAIEEQDLARHQEQLDHAVAHHEEELPPGASEEPPQQEPIIAAEQECPCGSGKPFMKCHGSELEDEASV
ncbi:MAG TPA: SEC-C metal-binding domain-containing protein, partial [Polyangium sp.]|nr:SEC-C metal-binding domain-containing protein [Polyangium sp.]